MVRPPVVGPGVQPERLVGATVCAVELRRPGAGRIVRAADAGAVSSMARQRRDSRLGRFRRPDGATRARGRCVHRRRAAAALRCCPAALVQPAGAYHAAGLENRLGPGAGHCAHPSEPAGTGPPAPAAHRPDVPRLAAAGAGERASAHRSRRQRAVAGGPGAAGEPAAAAGPGPGSAHPLFDAGQPDRSARGVERGAGPCVRGRAANTFRTVCGCGSTGRTGLRRGRTPGSGAARLRKPVRLDRPESKRRNPGAGKLGCAPFLPGAVRGARDPGRPPGCARALEHRSRTGGRGGRVRVQQRRPGDERGRHLSDRRSRRRLGRCQREPCARRRGGGAPLRAARSRQRCARMAAGRAARRPAIGRRPEAARQAGCFPVRRARQRRVPGLAACLRRHARLCAGDAAPCPHSALAADDWR